MRTRVETSAKKPVLQASTSQYGVYNSRIQSLTNETANDRAMRELNKLFGINQ
jgi:hypothetical protein